MTQDSILLQFPAIKPSDKLLNLSIMSDCDTESLLSVGSPTRTRKKGIVYLSSIPKYMNVTKLRELLGEYAVIGRVFLQPASNRNNIH